MSKIDFDKKNLTAGIAVKNEKEITSSKKPLQNLLFFFIFYHILTVKN